MDKDSLVCNNRLLFFIIIFLFPLSYALQIGETCLNSSEKCNAGLICSTCPANGNTRPRCTRIQPIIPTSKVKGLPFNRYSWLTTHNSFTISSGSTSATGSILLAPRNQDDTITNQLKNGVRGLMLDMYDFENDIWLCHSFAGKCYNFTAFQPAINVLKEVQVFLDQNPTEIVTIFIEDYVHVPMGLTNLFKAAGLDKFWFPVSRMPQKGDWPNVDDMVQKNQRLVVFTSVSSKEASEGIAYNWKYVIENQYGLGGMIAGSCPSRSQSPPMNTPTISLITMNYFPDNPNTTEVCSDNSSPLTRMMKTCYEAAGKRWPNFIAVDYYQRSDGGGSPLAVDEANGHMTCGCGNIAYCKTNAKFGTCDVPVLAPPPPAQLPPSTSQDKSKANQETIRLYWLIRTIFCIALVLQF